MLLGFGYDEVWQVCQIQRGLDLTAQEMDALRRGGAGLKLFKGEGGVTLTYLAERLPFLGLAEERLQVLDLAGLQP